MTIIKEAPFDAAAPSVGKTIMQRGRAVMALVAVAAVAAAGIPSTASATKPPKDPVVTELATFAAPACAGGCGSGSTVGPDKALYVTDGPGGRVLRVDPETGAVTTFASGLPARDPRSGHRRSDRCRLRRWQRVRARHPGRALLRPNRRRRRHLPDRGGRHCDGDRGYRRVVDLHPPATDFFIARRPVRAGEVPRRIPGHGRAPQPLLAVTRAGDISETMAFGNIVPTGLEVHGKTIHMAEAGPIPHLPPDGKVVRFTPNSAATELASGASLIVDVEFGPGRQLYALSQGIWDLPPTPENEGAPASRTRAGSCGSRGTEASRPSSSGSTGRHPLTSSARPPSSSRSRARSSGSTVPADVRPVQGDDPHALSIGGGSVVVSARRDSWRTVAWRRSGAARRTRPAGARSGAYVAGRAVARGARAVGSDVSERMLELARRESVAPSFCARTPTSFRSMAASRTRAEGHQPATLCALRHGRLQIGLEEGVLIAEAGCPVTELRRYPVKSMAAEPPNRCAWLAWVCG